MTKKAIKPAPATAPKLTGIASLTVGLDIGYGVTKAVAAGLAPVIFPSVCGKARRLSDFQEGDLAKRYPGDQLEDDEGAWYIGALAESQLTRPGELRRLRGRTADEEVTGNTFRVRMARAALGKLLPNTAHGDAVHVRISTGLPVEHMNDAPALKAALIGVHPIRTDSANFTANVTEVSVMPQPYGAIYSQMLTPDGDINPCHTAKRTGVVDVGTYTVDLALDADGEFIEAESGSVESGVYTAAEYLRERLEREYRQPIPLAVVEEVLKTSCFKVRNKSIDYTAVVNEALEPLRGATLALVNDKWRAGALVDVIYLSGGGAPLVEKTIREAGYSQTALIENAQLANALGYLRFALFRANNQA
jgi:hypothetical protein